MRQRLAALKANRQQLTHIIQQLPADDCYRQYHAELSPLAWHLGHCVYTELHWLQTATQRTDAMDTALTALYVPELSVKSERAAALPGHEVLLDWAAQQQRQCHAELARLNWQAKDNALLHNGYLLRFLAQHYAQHVETARLILVQWALQGADEAPLSAPLAAAAIDRECVSMPGGSYSVGYTGDGFHYDNEGPAFAVRLAGFSLARQPVSHGEYLSFIAAGGYTDRTCWSPAGWHWRVQHDIHAPIHWRQDEAGNWCAITLLCGHEISDETPLFGISHHEASAFARWAGARLPHEYEWEVACRQQQLPAVGHCWEWCANRFHPYPGFAAFPYAGYSTPWFDGRHYVLRGHSRHSLDCVQRPSFRNYYQPHQRHIQAGLRLCFH